MMILMHFDGDLSKSSRSELIHLKEVPYWHKAGSGIQEVHNRIRSSGKKTLNEMDTETIEVWTTTMFALALQHTEEKIFWLGKPKDDPPDMVVMTITSQGLFHVRELEVTRCRHAGEELINNILKKDRENKLSDKYILCGFVEVPGEYDLIKMGQDLKKKLTNIKNVVLVFHGVGKKNQNEVIDTAAIKNFWTVAQISPVFHAVTLDISTEYRMWMDDRDKLRYVKNMQIYAGKKNPQEPFPTILPDTPISF